MLEPSFYALYKQGRFRKRGLTDEEGMQQVERFAVAMLGFALKYDLVFRQSFLQTICECPDVEDPAAFDIEIEVAKCGDLVLVRNKSLGAYALEFKVGAKLQEHNQSPKNPDFFTMGYGAGIKSRYGVASTYIVVQNERADFSNLGNSVPRCLAKSWHDVYSCQYNNPIILDLFKSFGALGIADFIHMNTKHLKLGSTALYALKLYELLQAVAAKMEFKKSWIDAELEPHGKSGYIGLDFSSSSPDWIQLIHPVKSLGWFGYSDSEEGARLDMWFYCGSAAVAKEIQKRLEKRFPNARTSIDPKNNVCISLDAEKSTDDQEWFVLVFDTLVNREEAST